MARIYIGYHAGSTDALAQTIRRRLEERFGVSVDLDPPDDFLPGRDLRNTAKTPSGAAT